MRQYTKTGEKRFSILSRKGFYTRPILVHTTLQSAKKRFTLAGKVLKPHKPIMTKENALVAKKEILDYVNALTEAGINVYPTQVKLIPTKIKGKLQLNFIQDLIPKNQILFEYLKHCDEKQAITTFEKALNIFEKIEKYNQGKTKIGIDSSVLNLAIINGEISLIDIYPAYIKNNFKLTPKEAIREVRSPTIRFLTKLMPKTATAIAQKRIDNRFNTNSRKKSLLKHFIKIRPNLKTEFETILSQN